MHNKCAKELVTSLYKTIQQFSVYFHSHFAATCFFTKYFYFNLGDGVHSHNNCRDDRIKTQGDIFPMIKGLYRMQSHRAQIRQMAEYIKTIPPVFMCNTYKSHKRACYNFLQHYTTAFGTFAVKLVPQSCFCKTFHKKGRVL